MKIDVYVSCANSSKFLSVKEGKNLSDLTLPTETDQDYLTVSPFKKSIDLSIDRIAINSKDIEEQIKEKGYALHQAFIKVKTA